MSCLDCASHIDSLLREPPGPGPPDAQRAIAHLYMRVVHWCVSMYGLGRVRERWGVSAFSLQGPPPARSAPPDPTTALQVPVRICASVIPGQSSQTPAVPQTLRVRACVYTRVCARAGVRGYALVVCTPSVSWWDHVIVTDQC